MSSPYQAGTKVLNFANVPISYMHLQLRLTINLVHAIAMCTKWELRYPECRVVVVDNSLLA